jgi:hypothetical protein
MLARNLNDEVLVVIADHHLAPVGEEAVADSVVEVILAAGEEILVVEEVDLASVVVQAQVQVVSGAALVVAVAALAIAAAEVGHLVAVALAVPLVIAEVVVMVV